MRQWTAATILAATIILATGATACSPTPSGEAYLYVAAPITGDMSSRGQEIAGGARLRAEEANLAGGAPPVKQAGADAGLLQELMSALSANA